jgi:serine/threonine-protein kinase
VIDLIGAHLGNYEIRRELGAGGMGTVYLAEHPELGRKVAIKVLHDENASDPDTVARFFQEARAAAEIGQENIIEVIDVGTVELRGHPIVYLMMEALDGESLGARLRRGRPGPDEIRRILRQCCTALAASHAHGIVHRDIKPENIYLIRRGADTRFVKVLDFGIAKLVRGAGSGRTRIGTILGTPDYMSPEQCLGQGGVDPRSDIYALGVVLYEMLCGQTPFAGTLGEILQAHVIAAPVPPSQRAPDVSAELEAIALRCLAKRKEDRYQSMEELAAALDAPVDHRRAAPDAPTVHLTPAPAYAAPVAAAPTPPPTLQRHAGRRPRWRAWVAPLAIGGVVATSMVAGSIALRGWMDRRVDALAAAVVTLPPPPVPAVDAAVVAPPIDTAASPADAVAPATIRVRIVSEPPGAHVRAVDGARVIEGVAPLEIVRAPDGPVLVVTLTLRGRAAVTRRLSPTVDSELVIVMPPAPSPPRRTTRARPPTAPRDEDPDDLLPPPKRR